MVKMACTVDTTGARERYTTVWYGCPRTRTASMDDVLSIRLIQVLSTGFREGATVQRRGSRSKGSALDNTWDAYDAPGCNGRLQKRFRPALEAHLLTVHRVVAVSGSKAASSLLAVRLLLNPSMRSWTNAYVTDVAVTTGLVW
jgi:hypothetical protein